MKTGWHICPAHVQSPATGPTEPLSYVLNDGEVKLLVVLHF